MFQLKKMTLPPHLRKWHNFVCQWATARHMSYSKALREHGEEISRVFHRTDKDDLPLAVFRSCKKGKRKSTKKSSGKKSGSGKGKKKGNRKPRKKTSKKKTSKKKPSTKGKQKRSVKGKKTAGSKSKSPSGSRTVSMKPLLD